MHNSRAELFLRIHNLVLNSLDIIRKSGNAGSETYNTLITMEKRLLLLASINLDKETIFNE